MHSSFGASVSLRLAWVFVLHVLYYYHKITWHFCCDDAISSANSTLHVVAHVYQTTSSSKQTMTMTNERIVSTFCQYTFCMTSCAGRQTHTEIHRVHSCKVFTNLQFRWMAWWWSLFEEMKWSVYEKLGQNCTLCVN